MEIIHRYIICFNLCWYVIIQQHKKRSYYCKYNTGVLGTIFISEGLGEIKKIEDAERRYKQELTISEIIRQDLLLIEKDLKDVLGKFLNGEKLGKLGKGVE